MGKRNKKYKKRKKVINTRPSSYVWIYFLGYDNKIFGRKMPLKNREERHSRKEYFKTNYSNYLGSIGEPEYK